MIGIQFENKKEIFSGKTYAFSGMVSWNGGGGRALKGVF